MSEAKTGGWIRDGRDGAALGVPTGRDVVDIGGGTDAGSINARSDFPGGNESIGSA